MFYDLATKLFDSPERKIVEDAGPSVTPASQSDASGGTTTEDHISFIPSHMGERGKRVKKRKKKLISVKEAVSQDLRRLRDELKTQLDKLFSGEDFLLMENHFASWKSAFGIRGFRTHMVAVPIEDKNRGIRRIYGDLLRKYGDDKGNLEMLISAIEEGRPLGQFEVFNKFDNLFGSRVESKFSGVKLVFEETIDFIYDPSQSIYIEDPRVLDSVEEQFGGTIKRSRNVIYPIGGKFKIGFYNQLRSVTGDSGVEDVTE